MAHTARFCIWPRAQVVPERHRRPYARLRPAQVEEGVHIGQFRRGQGGDHRAAPSQHLSYIGDARVARAPTSGRHHHLQYDGAAKP